MPFLFKSINHTLGLLFLEGRDLKRQIGGVQTFMDFVIFTKYRLRQMNGWEGTRFRLSKLAK